MFYFEEQVLPYLLINKYLLSTFGLLHSGKTFSMHLKQ